MPPRPPFSPRPRAGIGRKLAIVFFAVLVPLAMLGLLIYFVDRLDVRRAGEEAVPGGVVHRLADGLVAVQNDPNSDNKVYYLVMAPRGAEAHIEFEDRTMTLVVRTDGGLRDLSRSVNWAEAPYAMMINYLQIYGATPKIPCTSEMVEGYLRNAGKDASVAQLMALLGQPATGTAP